MTATVSAGGCTPLWPSALARLLVFFFFQAEDGIRDLTVTGVQTCALPIWPRPPRLPGRPALVCGLHPPGHAGHGCRGHARLLPHLDRRAAPAARPVAAHLPRAGHRAELRGLRP